jgi:hypothetical protein
MREALGNPADIDAIDDVVVAEMLDDPNLLRWLDASAPTDDGGFIERRVDRELRIISTEMRPDAPRNVVIQATRDALNILNATRRLPECEPRATGKRPRASRARVPSSEGTRLQLVSTARAARPTTSSYRVIDAPCSEPRAGALCACAHPEPGDD